jgi:hypothetical protein
VHPNAEPLHGLVERPRREIDPEQLIAALLRQVLALARMYHAPRFGASVNKRSTLSERDARAAHRTDDQWLTVCFVTFMTLLPSTVRVGAVGFRSADKDAQECIRRAQDPAQREYSS